MSTKYKVRDPDKCYFITVTVVEWIDLFTRFNHRNTIIDSLSYCQKHKGLEIYAYVIMPSHIHLMCRSEEGHHLSDIIRDFKKFTSKRLIENILKEPESRREWLIERFKKACSHLRKGMHFKVWQDGYHGEEVSSNKFIYQKLDYIHKNPVAERLVQKPEDYLFSSARNYADLDSVLEVFLIPHKPVFMHRI